MRAAAPLVSAPGRQQRRRLRPAVAVPRAAVQPERQAGEEPGAPDAPPAAPTKPRGIEVELFETKGADAPPAGSSAGEDGGLLSGLLSSLDFSEPTTFDGEEKTEYDPLRDGPLRYLGYSNELGEAFAAWLFPGGVPLRWVLKRVRDMPCR